jgi:hypothetical protein
MTSFPQFQFKAEIVKSNKISWRRLQKNFQEAVSSGKSEAAN